MQNCMVLASLGPSKSNANGGLTMRNQTFSSNAVTIASNFSIHLTDPEFPSLASNVNQTTSECLQQYCDINADGIDAQQYCSPFGKIAPSGEDYENGGYCYPDICFGNVSTFLNPDIVGIGVW